MSWVPKSSEHFSGWQPGEKRCGCVGKPLVTHYDTGDDIDECEQCGATWIYQSEVTEWMYKPIEAPRLNWLGRWLMRLALLFTAVGCSGFMVNIPERYSEAP